MSDTSCGCRLFATQPCAARATAEDLLCDACRLFMADLSSNMHIGGRIGHDDPHQTLTGTISGGRIHGTEEVHP